MSVRAEKGVGDLRVPAPTGRSLLPADPSALYVLPACIAIGAFLLLPLGYLLILGFNPSIMGVIEISGDFTVANFAKFLSSPFYWRIMGETVLLSAVSTAICTVFGCILALAIWRAPPGRKAILVIIVLSPLLVSIVTRTFGWMIVLGDNGLINSLLVGLGLVETPLRLMFTEGAVIVGLVHVFLPLMVLPILAALDRIDPSVPEAASTLGASEFTIITQIILPIASPGLIAGTTIVFSLAMSSYVTPALMGGPDSGVITTLIYQQFIVSFNWQFGAVLVTMLLATSLTVVGLLLFLFGRRTGRWISG